MAQVAANDNNQAPAEKLPDYERIWRQIRDESDDICATIDAMKDRTFFEGSSYKKRMGLEREDPGKQQFRSLQTAVRGLKKEAERMYKSKRPKQKREPKEGGNSTHGFNRLVITSPALAEFMRLADWNVSSQIRRDCGIVTHGIITRWICNYVALMNLRNPSKTATFKADAALKKLFDYKDGWKLKNVDPEAISYTDLQKLIALHMATAPAQNFDLRSDEDYRKQLVDDESAAPNSLGVVSKTIHTLRGAREDIYKDILKYNRFYKQAQKDEALKGTLAPLYKKTLEDLVASYAAKTDEMVKVCDENGIPYSQDITVKLVTALDE